MLTVRLCLLLGLAAIAYCCGKTAVEGTEGGGGSGAGESGGGSSSSGAEPAAAPSGGPEPGYGADLSGLSGGQSGPGGRGPGGRGPGGRGPGGRGPGGPGGNGGGGNGGGGNGGGGSGSGEGSGGDVGSGENPEDVYEDLYADGAGGEPGDGPPGTEEGDPPPGTGEGEGEPGSEDGGGDEFGGEWPNAPANWPPPAGGRNAQEASIENGNALDAVLAFMSAGDVSQVPLDTMLQIPPGSLGRLSEDKLTIMPDIVLAKLTQDAAIKSRTIGEMVQFLPVDKVVTLPWETIIVGIPPDAVNSYSPTILGAIPWEDVLSEIPPDTMGGFSTEAMGVIPPEAWRTVSFRQLSAMRPESISSLPLASLRAIPPGHLRRLGPSKLGGFSKDVLVALDPQLLQQVIGSGSGLRGSSGAARANIAAQTVNKLGSRRAKRFAQLINRLPQL